jgi:hypothetical protein
MGDVPHPGPQPAPFEFPFSQAREAVDAIEALAEELGRLVDRHADAAEVATRGFHGTTADAFDELLAATLEALGDDVRTLRAHADLLAQDTTVARQRRDDSLEARRRWQVQHRAWEQAQQAS